MYISPKKVKVKLYIVALNKVINRIRSFFEPTLMGEVDV